MRFPRAVDAYRWYRTRRYQVDHPAAMTRPLYYAGPAARTVVALVDIERMLGRLSLGERRALRDNAPDCSDALKRFEGLLREGDYLTH